MGYQEIPAYTEQADADRLILKGSLHGGPGPEYTPGPDLTVDEDTQDSGNTPVTTLRPGRVLVVDSGDGLAYPADAVADEGSATRRCQPASIETLISLATNLYEDGSATFNVNGGPDIVVAFAHTDNTAALFAAALNNNKAFAGQLKATVTNTNKVTVKTSEAGRNMYLRARCSLATVYGADGIRAKGSDAAYFVTMGHVRMLDRNGAVRDSLVRSARAAWFITSALLGSTPEAEAVLQRNGSIFD